MYLVGAGRDRAPGTRYVCIFIFVGTGFLPPVFACVMSVPVLVLCIGMNISGILCSSEHLSSVSRKLVSQLCISGPGREIKHYYVIVFHFSIRSEFHCQKGVFLSSVRVQLRHLFGQVVAMGAGRDGVPGTWF